MARPEEKAQNMMNKWVKMKEASERATLYSSATGEATGNDPRKKKRPYLASMCEYLNDAEIFRKQIIREISDGIRKIQNAGMDEHSIRDLNDHINKLLREKKHWNKRIQELGGINYNIIERRQAEAEGGDELLGLKGSGGYRYFGAARDLPGVKELFMKQAVKDTKRKRSNNVHKYISPDYFGLRDEEDGVLLELETEAERKRRRQMGLPVVDESNSSHNISSKSTVSSTTGTNGMFGGLDLYIKVPSQEEVARQILAIKKKQLLDRLAF